MRARRRALALSAAVAAGLGGIIWAAPAGAGGAFATPGVFTIEVPAGTTSVTMVLAGASGADDEGLIPGEAGVGTQVTVTQPVVACSDLTVTVGGAGSVPTGGENGGGPGGVVGAGGGGGASQVNGPLGELLAIAGGGGGAGDAGATDGDGGSGPNGAPVAVTGGTAIAGTDGQVGSGGFGGGGGGTASGGQGGGFGSGDGGDGTGPATTSAGSGGFGGPGNGGGGGGGAGWFGGGGAQGSGLGGGGGSGSSFVADGSTGVAFATAPFGDGSVTLTFEGAGTGTCAVIDATTQTDGRTVEVTGSDFPGDTTVTVTIESTPVELGTVQTDADGTFAASFLVPCEVGAGEHLVIADGGDAQATAGVTLDPCATPPTPIDVVPTFTG